MISSHFFVRLSQSLQQNFEFANKVIIKLRILLAETRQTFSKPFVAWQFEEDVDL